MSTFAVYVTLNPESDFFKNIAFGASQVDAVIIVDNNSSSHLVEALKEISKKIKNIELISLSENLGLASGLNMGVRRALELNAEFIFTFDQDSIPQAGMISRMVDTYRQDLDAKHIGLLAPSFFDANSGRLSQWFDASQSAYSQTEIVITSGSLVHSSVFKKVGLFDDELFIDYVDHDFCLRLKRAGYKIGIVREAQMSHQLGATRHHSFGFFSFFSLNHSPVRRYYMSRNRVILYRRHFFTKMWILRDLRFAIKDFVKIILVETNKWAKIKSIIAGTADGFLGRLGSNEGAEHRTPKAQKYFVELREEIFPFLTEKSVRALDIGCGSGETSRALKKMGRFEWVCGVEGSPEAANLARKALDQVVEGDIETIEFPFEPETFDVILTLDILEHLIDPWATLDKLVSLLKPGGILVASLPNVRHYSVVIPLIFFGDWRYQQEGLLDSTHIRFFTRSTAQKFFVKRGLIVEMQGHTGATGTLGKLVRRMFFGRLDGFLDFQVLLKMRKPKVVLKSEI